MYTYLFVYRVGKQNMEQFSRHFLKSDSSNKKNKKKKKKKINKKNSTNQNFHN